MKAKVAPTPINLEKAENYLLTFHDFMAKALYDENFGYYASGKVKFEVDFDTYAEEYAPLLADRFLFAWQGLRNAKLIEPAEKFYIYEFAAGSGKMASRLLHYVKGKSVTDPNNWLEFYRNLHYVIGEISPALVEKQKTLLHRFIRLNRVSIHTLNAICTVENFPRGKGVVVSNELLDALPVEEVAIRREASDQLSYSITVTAPTLPKSLFAALQSTTKSHTDELQKAFTPDPTLLEKWHISSQEIRRLQKENVVYISKDLMHFLLSPEYRSQYGSKIKIEKWSVPLTHFDPDYQARILQRCSRKEALTKQVLQEQKREQLFYYLPYGTAAFLENIKSFLQSGYVFTLDYGRHAYAYLGDVAAGRIFLRTFSKQYQSNDVVTVGDNLCFTSTDGGSTFDHIGEKDITMDVDFTDFAEIGIEKGIIPIYFGTQDSLGGYYIPRFSFLVQEYNLTSSAQTRHETLFQGMLPTGSVLLSAMSGLRQQLEYAQQHVHQWKQAFALRDETKVKSAFLATLIALKDHAYLQSNYAVWHDLEYEIRYVLCDTLKYKLVNSTSINELLSQRDGKLYAEILLSIIRHHLWAPHPPGHEQLMAQLDNFLRPVAQRIVEVFPDLDQKSLNAKTLNPYNFANMPEEVRTKTMLSITLATAERLVQEEVRVLDNNENASTAPSALPMWNKPAAKPAAAATTSSSSQQNTFGFKPGFLL